MPKPSEKSVALAEEVFRRRGGVIIGLIVELLDPVLQEAGSDSFNATWNPGRGWE